MGISAAIAAAVAVAGANTAIQSHQQSIAAQKQKDAANDAQKRQDEMIANQKAQDAELKKKEEAATQQAFMKTAASRTRNFSSASLPGAVAAAPQSVGGGQAAAKRLIGS
jgi:hypothetical protein